MTNNKAVPRVKDEDFPAVVRAQNKVQGLYTRLGNWRAVMKELELGNVAYAYDLVTHGKVPPNPETRAKLFLPRKLPSERVRKKKRVPLPLLGSPGWEVRWLRHPRVNRHQRKAVR